MNGLPKDVSIVDSRHAHCHICGAGMTCSEPWQLVDLCRRHVAESHPDPRAAIPPSAARTAPPTG